MSVEITEDQCETTPYEEEILEDVPEECNEAGQARRRCRRRRRGHRHRAAARAALTQSVTGRTSSTSPDSSEEDRLKNLSPLEIFGLASSTRTIASTKCAYANGLYATVATPSRNVVTWGDLGEINRTHDAWRSHGHTTAGRQWDAIPLQCQENGVAVLAHQFQLPQCSRTMQSPTCIVPGNVDPWHRAKDWTFSSSPSDRIPWPQEPQDQQTRPALQAGGICSTTPAHGVPHAAFHAERSQYQPIATQPAWPVSNIDEQRLTQLKCSEWTTDHANAYKQWLCAGSLPSGTEIEELLTSLASEAYED